MNALSAPERANPMFVEQDALRPQWTTLDSMRTVDRYGPDDAQMAQRVGVGDLSARRRCGYKGPGAAAWLLQHGVPIPPQPNTWRELPSGGLVARLGRSEFLIEDAPGGAQCASLHQHAPPERVYPVLRQDTELVLTGPKAGELLLQTCSVDFGGLDLALRPAVLTSMVGVGVTVIAEPAASVSSGNAWRYRIWCDATFGAYLWQTLVEVARDLGGGPVGLEALGAPTQRP
jgi:sarcosine oxidase, subunit gamma